MTSEQKENVERYPMPKATADAAGALMERRWNAMNQNENWNNITGSIGVKAEPTNLKTCACCASPATSKSMVKEVISALQEGGRPGVCLRQGETLRQDKILRGNEGFGIGAKRKEPLMKCPKCDSKLVYEEEIEGKFSYPIRDGGIIDFEQKEFNGDNLNHRIKCTNPDCNYVMPPKESAGYFLNL